MRRFAPIALAALLLLLPVSPLFAAEEPEAENAKPGYRCEWELEDCLNWMAKHYGERGWAGMQLDIEGFRYTVTGIQEGSPAQKGGIQAGDLLVAVNGVEISEENQDKLLKIRDKMLPGAQFTYTIKRKGKRRNIECVLVAMPVEVAAEQIGMHLLIGHLEPDLAFEEPKPE
jgi:predicted metalloprotease with PDZ domain